MQDTTPLPLSDEEKRIINEYLQTEYDDDPFNIIERAFHERKTEKSICEDSTNCQASVLM